MPSSSNNKKYVVGNTFSLKSFLLFVLFYLAGYFTSARNLELMQQLLESLLSNVTIFPRKVASVSSSIRVLDNDAPVELIMDVEECFNQLLSHLSPGGMSGDGKLLEPFEQLTLVLHRNGQAEACGETSGVNNFVVEIKNVLDEMRQQGLPCSFEKYQVESLLTRFFHKLAPTCHSEDEDRAAKDFGFYGFCDMGEAKTPILMDHQKLVYVKDGERSFLPCHFHNANGVRVTSLQQLTDFALRAVASNNNSKDCTTADEEEAKTCSASALRELHLYAVPAGRVFLHSAAYVGQIIDLPHVKGGDPDLPVCLEVLSISPAIFDLHNFFTKEESQNLVDRALAESKESHRIKRSTTGAVNGEVNERRTSESGFDTDGETSMLVKKRCFDVLGFDEYIESHADGLQILRYNITTSYTDHLDYIDADDKLEHDYDSARKGGNRFATILLYMTDLGGKDGGETVFTEAWPTGQATEDRVNIESALKELRESDQAGILKDGSWQETMVAKCRTRLAIQPNSARAVLFYSQLPNGEVDPMSRHGACPVLAGTKYAANLWVWSTPRDGYPGNPKNSKYKSKEDKDDVPVGRVTATFRNDGNDPALANAKLYFQNGSELSFWGDLGHGSTPLNVYTYTGHVWKLMVDGEDKRTWTIESEHPSTQDYVI